MNATASAIAPGRLAHEPWLVYGHDAAPTTAPSEVTVIQVLGHGRAAQAQLVDAKFADGSTVRCVEKVFNPGRLTRWIYRLGFQAPFAYQKSEHAIMAAFYRRRVAAAVFAHHGNPASVARPLYVRFDADQRCWILAARWIEGRGIRPAPARNNRITERIRRIGMRKQLADTVLDSTPEIRQITTVMRKLETLLCNAGLYGSGWQVSPRAMVSTANLLRVDDRYTVIDLESGIPAVLDPKYVWNSIRRGALPPFDDLDPQRLRSWFQAEKSRMEGYREDEIATDIEELIHHSEAWKRSEFSLARRPWTWISSGRRASYREQLVQRWYRDQLISDSTRESLTTRRLQFASIWCAGLLPGTIGRVATRCLGRKESRANVLRFFLERDYRRHRIEKYRDALRDRWLHAGRIRNQDRARGWTFPIHQILARTSPRRVQRWLTDPITRRHSRRKTQLLVFSTKYRERVVNKRIQRAIDRWSSADRISPFESAKLHRESQGPEARAYVQGAAWHVGIKALAPILMPAKLGGIVAFFASGNPWFLLPLLLMPLLRTIATLANAWSHRKEQVPHTEALLVSWIPTLGSLAFPIQMFATCESLSTFLIRDAASQLSHKIPIYGGKDSRTEMAFIAATDFLVEALRYSVRAARLLRPRRSNKYRQSDVGLS